MSVLVQGKIILSGEHAVVYGKMALAASIDKGVTVEIFLTDKPQEWNEIVTKAVEVAGGDETLELNIQSELPVGSGLGSSAAVAAAVIRGVREYLGKPIENDELFKLVMECEKIAHGNPSGIDPAAVVYGGLIAFAKGKSIEKLVIKKPLKILLVNTGKPEETTKEMVELVASIAGKEKYIDEIGEISQKIKNMLLIGENVSELINKNGLSLEKLGVVGKRAIELCNNLRSLGYGVKIVGAGGVRSGSGMMMVMGDNFVNAIKLLEQNNLTYFETIIGGI